MKPTINLNWEEVFNSMHDGLIILSPSGKILKMNPAGERLTGLSLEAVAGLSLKKAFPFNEEVWKVVVPLFEERRTRALREIKWHQGPGSSFVVDLLLSPMASGWLLFLRDVTPLKMLEEDLRRSDRLATAGTIAAGLAHEIKNPLSGIRGAAELLARKGCPDDMKECFDIIIKETTRVDRLVSELLILGNPKRLSLHPLNINKLLNEILILQEGTMRERKIQLLREYDPSLPPIEGDEEQLTQALLNFIRNSLEAMEEGKGILKVKTRIENDFRIKGEKGEEFQRVEVEISDNGCGMGPEELEKIFIPFFTTKKEGTGLGMAIAKGIIDQHRGILQVTSEKGKGTTLHVYLKGGL